MGSQLDSHFTTSQTTMIPVQISNSFESKKDKLLPSFTIIYHLYDLSHCLITHLLYRLFHLPSLTISSDLYIDLYSTYRSDYIIITSSTRPAISHDFGATWKVPSSKLSKLGGAMKRCWEMAMTNWGTGKQPFRLENHHAVFYRKTHNKL